MLYLYTISFDGYHLFTHLSYPLKIDSKEQLMKRRDLILGAGAMGLAAPIA